METQESVFSLQNQVVDVAGPLADQITEAAPEQLRLMPTAKQTNDSPATSKCLGVAEIVLRALCTVSNGYICIQFSLGAGIYTEGALLHTRQLAIAQ